MRIIRDSLVLNNHWLNIFLSNYYNLFIDAKIINFNRLFCFSHFILIKFCILVLGNLGRKCSKIKILNFITVKTKKSEKKINSEQKKAIDEALEAVKQGKTIPHKQAMKRIKEKHPKYF